MHVVVFTIEIHSDARPYERQISKRRVETIILQQTLFYVRKKHITFKSNPCQKRYLLQQRVSPYSLNIDI